MAQKSLTNEGLKLAAFLGIIGFIAWAAYTGGNSQNRPATAHLDNVRFRGDRVDFTDQQLKEIADEAQRLRERGVYPR